MNEEITREKLINLIKGLFVIPKRINLRKAKTKELVDFVNKKFKMHEYPEFKINLKLDIDKDGKEIITEN